ncbi:MAG: SU10 major capsid protein [Bacteroidales bacterium]
MTVLKNFDLKGNKQSFAGWISNLSPCDTPFVSMIGKEGISQTQYSWQLDALGKPRAGDFEEGSLVEPEKREGTHILHNFTSILRKVAHVSDTVASMSTYGRNKEMEYQMGKAGKELKRDMEFMCLNNGDGNIGTGSMASKFSGFASLCAPEHYVDVDTGAKTHKAITVADLAGPWFKASDIFDLTYNLYLAGSKANKIMFHPCHATTFSDFVSNNIEAGQTYRMFDNVDNRYNAQVTKIRDPLGQKYDLISNRFMPKSKIYIFNESDWTQMILRAPSATKLAKQGSSDRFLLESEIGLRHRHINASGVLDMDPSTLLMQWTDKPTPLTWGLGASTDIAEITVLDRKTGIAVPGGTVVNWTSSNPAVLALTDATGHTKPDTGEATNLLLPLRPGTSIVTATCGDGSASYLVTVKDPLVKLTMAGPVIERDGKSLAVVQVLKADGKPVPNGVRVDYNIDPANLVNFPEKFALTTGDSGTAQIELSATGVLGLVQVQAYVGTVFSNRAKLDIVEKVEAMGIRVSNRTIARSINDKSILEVFVLDATGKAIPNQSVSLLSTDQTVINIRQTPVDTGGTGIYSVALTAINTGNTEISAQYKGQRFSINMVVSEPDILLAGPNTYVVGTPFDMTATIKRSDGSAVGAGIEVDFTSTPNFTAPITVTTNDKGVATGSYTSMNNSDYEVEAKAGLYTSNSIVIEGPSLVK